MNYLGRLNIQMLIGHFGMTNVITKTLTIAQTLIQVI